MDDFKGLKTKVDNHELQITNLKKMISQLSNSLKNMPKDGGVKVDIGSHHDVNGDLEEELKKLRQALDDYRNMNDKRVSDLQRALDDKASKQDLIDLE